MNNGYRWLSDNELEIMRDNDIVVEKTNNNIDATAVLSYQNIIEILENRMDKLSSDISNNIRISIINNKLLMYFLVGVLITGSLYLIFSDITFFSFVLKFFSGLLIYFGGQKLIYSYLLNQLKNEYNATMEVKNKYESFLEKSLNVEQNISNSRKKSINFISLEEYNSLFYNLVDKQVDRTLQEGKVKKLALKKKK